MGVLTFGSQIITNFSWNLLLIQITLFMQNSRNIFTMKVEPKSQNHVSIFDMKHSGNPSTNIFSANTQPNNKELKVQSKSIFPFGKTPATNIFNASTNPTPQVTNIFNSNSNSNLTPTPQANIFASEKSPDPITQAKNPFLNKNPITAFNFSTPIKELSSPKLDSANEEKKLSDKKFPLEQNDSNRQNLKEQTVKQGEKAPSQISICNFPATSSKSQGQSKINISQLNSESKHIQLFSKISFQKKTQNQGSNKKQEESFDLSSANDGRKKQQSMRCQMKSVQEKDQSREFQNLTFQKKSDSKKLQNEEISFGDNLREQVNNIFSAEQKVQTPKKHDQKQMQNVKEQKILSVIQEKQVEQSPFHRHEIQANLLSSKSSTPSYMNQTSSPNLSYMDNVSSKRTTQKVSELLFQSVKKEQKTINEKLKEMPFQGIQIQSKTQSQNIIYVQKVEFSKQQEAKQSEKISEPQNVNVQNNDLDSLEARRQKRAQDFKSYLERNQTKKSPKQQVPKFLIKRTESQSDSESHSFSSRDLGVSRHQQKCSKSPFKEGIGKLTNIFEREVVTTGTGGYEGQKSNEKQQQVENKKQRLKVGKFVEEKEPERKPILGVERKGEQKPQKNIENDLLELDRTNSLDYSDTTHKIQSSTNTIVVKSLIQQQKSQINQYGIGKNNAFPQINISKKQDRLIKKQDNILQKQNNISPESLSRKNVNVEKQAKQNDSDDEDLQVPLMNERKFTFGKTLQIQNQFKLSNDTIQNELKRKQNKISNSPNPNNSNVNTKKQESSKSEQIIPKFHNSPQLFSQDKSLSLKPLQCPKPSLKQQSTIFSKTNDSLPKSVNQKQQICSAATKTSLKPNETQMENIRRIKHQLQQAKKRICSKIGIFKKQISSLDSRLKQVNLHRILNQQKQTAQNIHQLIISAFRSQNYYDLIPQQKIQAKIQTSSQKIKYLQMTLDFSIKWAQKLKQISQTYLSELDQQKSEIQKQQTLIKNNSFFTTFNIKRNKYCAKDSSYKIIKSDLKKPKKALQFLQSTLKQILNQKTQQYLNLEVKCEQILKKRINVEFSNFVCLNQSNKIPVKSKIFRILPKNQKQNQAQKIKNVRYHQLFNSKKVKALNRSQNFEYFKNIQQRFLKNLKKSRNQLKHEKQQSVNIQSQSLNKQFSSSTKKLQNSMRRIQIKNRYQNLIGVNKSKIFFGAYEDSCELMSGQYNDEELRKEQEIIKKVKVNKDINRLMHHNVSVKLKCINFKTQVFLL